MRKPPPVKNRKLLIIATTSSKDFFDQADVTQNFHVTMHIPILGRKKDIAKILSKQPGWSPNDALSCAEACGEGKRIGVQQLITVAEMAAFKAKNMNIPVKDAFMDCLP